MKKEMKAFRPVSAKMKIFFFLRGKKGKKKNRHLLTPILNKTKSRLMNQFVRGV